MVVVRPIAAPPPTTGLVIGVQLEHQPAMRGEILSVGPEVRDLQPGQHVLFSRLQGFSLEIGEPTILLAETAVLATL